MWNRQLYLEPEVANRAQEVARRLLLEALPHWVSQTGAALTPATTQCEPMRLVQLPQRMQGSEIAVCAAFYSDPEDERDLAAVILSNDLAARFADPNMPWPARIHKLGEAARALLGEMPMAFGASRLEDPIFVFDMHNTALESLATIASLHRHLCVATHSYLRGESKGEWAQVLYVCDTQTLERQLGSTMRRAA